MTRHTYTRPRFGTLFALMGALVLTTGCGNVIGPEKALQLYTLEPQTTASALTHSVTGQLSIDVPDAEASLNTSRIALNPTPATMDYFANAAWPDRLPLLFQSRLVESFEKDGRMASVARDTAGLHADYLLKSEIRSFQARYDAPDSVPDVQLRIDVTLVDVATGRVIARKEMIEQVRAAQNAVPAVTLAFNAAAAAILKDIVDWTVTGIPPLARPGK